ncbi:MAG TPA: vanomycin resistance protein VanB [Firmicutes bacterium]|nr:vanomycin resistance protein VanB [Bacillota bacterium]
MVRIKCGLAGLFAAIFLAATLGAAAGAGGFYLAGSRAFTGVSLDGLDVGGCDPATLTDIVRELGEHVERQPVVLIYDGHRYTIMPAEIGARIDVPGTVRAVLRAGRHGSLAERARAIVLARRQGLLVSLSVSVDRKRLRDVLLKLASEINIEPRSATLDIETGTIVPERPGRRLVLHRLEAGVMEAAGRVREREVVVPVEIIPPKVGIADIKRLGIAHLVSSYRTLFDPSNSNRVHNIRLTALKLNGTLVRPGGIFSFNETVGPREREYGFLEAREIVSNEFVPGIGGGVCQVASTLYNAVLLANQEIIERHPHSLPVTYVPLGRDATVYYGTLDLRFQNVLPYPILVQAEVTGSEITTSIIGSKPPSVEVRVITERMEREDPPVIERVSRDIPQGERVVEQEGSCGYLVTTVRLVVKNGKEVRRETVSVDRYPPVPAIVRVGGWSPSLLDLSFLSHI